MHRFRVLTDPVLAVSLAAAAALASVAVHAAILDALPGHSMSGSEIIARGEGYPVSELVEFQLVDTLGGGLTPADRSGPAGSAVIVPAELVTGGSITAAAEATSYPPLTASRQPQSVVER